MLKISLAFLFALGFLVFLLSERYCQHGFEIINETSFPLQAYIKAGHESFGTDVIHPNHQKNYRFDLRKFEGDLFLDVKHSSQEKWQQYDIGYTYQGDPSDYVITIEPESVSSEVSENDDGFISTVKLFFTSLARYKGCYARI